MPNLSRTHRTIRVIVGLVIVALTPFFLSGLPIVCGVLAGGLIALSGFAGYCPACAVLKPRR